MHNFCLRKKTILVTTKGARKASQIGCSNKGSISVREWDASKETGWGSLQQPLTQTPERLTGCAPPTRVGFTPGLFRDTTAASLWAQAGRVAASCPVSQHMIIRGKGGTVLLPLLKCCVRMWSVSPHPRLLCWRHGHGSVPRKNISPLWTLLFLTLFISFWLSSPAPSPSIFLSPLPGHHEVSSFALQCILCHDTVSHLEASSHGALSGESKEIRPYVVFSSILSLW